MASPTSSYAGVGERLERRELLRTATGVTMFTRASVHWAESRTANSSS